MVLVLPNLLAHVHTEIFLRKMRCPSYLYVFSNHK